MNSRPFTNLRFERRWQMRFSPRAIWLLVTVGAYLVAWTFLPSSGVFWLGLVSFVALAWVASFSWRDALNEIDQLIHRLEQL